MNCIETIVISILEITELNITRISSTDRLMTSHKLMCISFDMMIFGKYVISFLSEDNNEFIKNYYANVHEYEKCS